MPSLRGEKMSKEFDANEAKIKGMSETCIQGADGEFELDQHGTESFVKGARWMFSQCRDEIDKLKNEIDCLQQYNDAAVLTQERDRLLAENKRIEQDKLQYLDERDQMAGTVIALQDKNKLLMRALEKYKSIAVCLEDGDTFVADETLEAIGDKGGE